MSNGTLLIEVRNCEFHDLFKSGGEYTNGYTYEGIEAIRNHLHEYHMSDPDNKSFSTEFIVHAYNQYESWKQYLDNNQCHLIDFLDDKDKHDEFMDELQNCKQYKKYVTNSPCVTPKYVWLEDGVADKRVTFMKSVKLNRNVVRVPFSCACTRQHSPADTVQGPILTKEEYAKLNNMYELCLKLWLRDTYVFGDIVIAADQGHTDITQGIAALGLDPCDPESWFDRLVADETLFAKLDNALQEADIDGFNWWVGTESHLFLDLDITSFDAALDDTFQFGLDMDTELDTWATKKLENGHDTCIVVSKNPCVIYEPR